MYWKIGLRYVWMSQYLDMSEVVVVLFELWRYLHLQTPSHYQTHSSASQLQNLCKKIDAICIMLSVKKLQLGKTVKCHTPYTQTHPCMCLSTSVNSSIAPPCQCNIEKYLKLTVTSHKAHNFSASELGLSVKTSDRLTQHHTVYTLHINNRHKTQGALNSIQTAHYIKMYDTQKWLKNLALLCHFNMFISN
jgi:hypothetical protein